MYIVYTIHHVCVYIYIYNMNIEYMFIQQVCLHIHKCIYIYIHILYAHMYVDTYIYIYACYMQLHIHNVYSSYVHSPPSTASSWASWWWAQRNSPRKGCPRWWKILLRAWAYCPWPEAAAPRAPKKVRQVKARLERVHLWERYGYVMVIYGCMYVICIFVSIYDERMDEWMDGSSSCVANCLDRAPVRFARFLDRWWRLTSGWTACPCSLGYWVGFGFVPRFKAKYGWLPHGFLSFLPSLGGWEAYTPQDEDGFPVLIIPHESGSELQLIMGSINPKS